MKMRSKTEWDPHDSDLCVVTIAVPRSTLASTRGGDAVARRARAAAADAGGTLALESMRVLTEGLVAFEDETINLFVDDWIAVRCEIEQAA